MKKEATQPNQLPISIGILAWNNLKTLENSLKSYQKNGLLKLSDDIVILFQEMSDSDKALAKKYGLKYIGLQENIGIGKGLVKLMDSAFYSKMLFLEHDWELIENQNTVFHQLQKGIDLMDKDGFDVIRYRSRRKPGHPLFSYEKYFGKELDYYDEWHEATSPHLLETLYWLDPAKEFSDKIQKKEDFFVTNSRWANWTNNPFLINTSFFLDTIAPFAGDKVSFERNIAPWWVKQDFKIAQGEGLFTHNDFIKYPPLKIRTKVKRWLKKLLQI